MPILAETKNTIKMKRVYSNSHQVAHAWANRESDEGRTSCGHIYFRGDTIYSYGSHFAIAKHVVNERGERAILFTTDSYSPSTGKHIGIVRNASSHLTEILCLKPDCDAKYDRETNYNWWLSKISCLKDKAERARNPLTYIRMANSLMTSAKSFAEFFGDKIPRKLTAAYKWVDNPDLQAKGDAYESIQKERMDKKIARNFEQAQASIQMWLNFETDYIAGSFLGRDYLRLNPDTRRVETSQRVVVPLEAARRLWEKVKNDTLVIGDVILNYHVRSVSDTIRIGCHSFPRQYLIDFGQGIFK